MCLLWYGSSMWDVDNNNLWPPSRFLPRRLSCLSVPCPSSRAINIYDQTTHIHNRGASSPSKMTIYVSGPLFLLFLFDPFVSMSESFHWNCHSSFCLLLIFPVHVFLSFSRCINVYTFLLFPLSRNMRRGPNDFLRFYLFFFFS